MSMSLKDTLNSRPLCVQEGAHPDVHTQLLLEEINSHFHHQTLVPGEPGRDLGIVTAEGNGLHSRCVCGGVCA